MTQAAKKPATSMLREEVQGALVSYATTTSSRFRTPVITCHHEA
jgi:hypothetical protein